MGISPHEQQQFESLVANFNVEDTGLVKAMERRAKATEMTFTPLPNLPLYRIIMFYTFLLCSLACSPASFFLVKEDIQLSLMILMAGPMFLLFAYQIRPRTKRLAR